MRSLWAIRGSGKIWIVPVVFELEQRDLLPVSHTRGRTPYAPNDRANVCPWHVQGAFAATACGVHARGCHPWEECELNAGIVRS